MKRLSKTKAIALDILLIVAMTAVFIVSLFYSRDLELRLGLAYYEDVPVQSGEAQTSSFASDDGALEIHYLNVDQADCTIIEFPDRKTMIVDGGENNKTTEQAIQKFIDTTLGETFKYFDYAILTHPDSDHCGSLDYVLNKYPARFCYRPNVEASKAVDPGKADLTDGAYKKSTATYYDCIAAMYKRNDDFTPVVYVTDPADPSQTIKGENDLYTFTFYSPLSDKYGSASKPESNDYSPIMILSYRGFNFAMSGDAETENEAEFCKKVLDARNDGIDDKYDIFTDDYTVHAVKCGHHGSRTSTSEAYLDAITTPSGAKNAYYIISCGLENKHGHPHKETLDRIKGKGVDENNILYTYTGDITLSVRESDGQYKLFNGQNESTQTPEPTVPTEKKLVYVKLGNVTLTWTKVGGVVYSIICFALLLHIAYLATRKR